MISSSQLQVMLTLQSEMNTKVNSAWLEAKYPYLRAAWIEGAEAVEHHGWKWWKKQTCDIAQLQMEIIDIWHFILSDVLLKLNGNIDESIAMINTKKDVPGVVIFDGIKFNLFEMTLVPKIELLVGLATVRRIDIELFALIMQDCGLNWSDLYLKYVSKNVLNIFRQDHGYKSGSYQKTWFGREDNEVLVDLASRLDNDSAEFATQLYSELKAEYSKVVAL